MSAGQSEEVVLERDSEPVVLVPCHALPMVGGMLVGWLCWDGPPQTKPCSRAFSSLADQVVECEVCGREFGVFTNRSAAQGAVVVMVR